MRQEPTAIVVPREGEGARLDRFASRAIGVSRAELQRWIDDGRVTVDGTVRLASAKLHAGQCVTVLPDAAPRTQAAADASVRFEVLHVDEDLLVIDKPAGLVVHPARGHAAGTLVNGLLALGLFRLTDWTDAVAPVTTDDGRRGAEGADHVRPGIVHRLDKGTSGVMVVARTPAAREALKRQFQAHSIDRAYEAIVAGDARSATYATLHGRHPVDRLRFTTRVAHGKRAVTHVRVLRLLAGATHVECTLETGRTHQIRVHLAESGTPILGDGLYGRAPGDTRVREIAARLGHQALHARLLGFSHPRHGGRVRFESAPPADFVATLRALEGLTPS